MRTQPRSTWLIFVSLFISLSIAITFVFPLSPHAGLAVDLTLLAVVYLLWQYYENRHPNRKVRVWLEELNSKENLESVLEHLDTFPTRRYFWWSNAQALAAAEDHLAKRFSTMLSDFQFEPMDFRKSLEQILQALRQLETTTGIIIMVKLFEEMVEDHVQNMNRWGRFPEILNALPKEVPAVGKLTILKWAHLLKDLESTEAFDARMALFHEHIGRRNPFDCHQQAAIFLQLIERKPASEVVSDMTGLRIASMLRTYWNFLAKRERQFLVQLGVDTGLSNWMTGFYFAYLPEFTEAEARALLTRAEHSDAMISEVLKSVY